MMRPLFVLLIAAAASSPASAQVHKCVEDGRTVYSQTPCAAKTPRDPDPVPGVRAAGDDDMRREIEAELVRLRAEDEEHRKQEEIRAREEKRKADELRRLTAPDMTPCGNKGMAYVMSQTAVERVLRAPSSARFPYSPVASKFLGNCKWFVMGEVDAQNAFGAMLRTTYSATLQYHPSTDGWSVIKVDVDPVR